ncbi:hypothetical protein [Porphyrobacter sp. GA68]|uniref:hypothetical protein n=1 Tax=Porphyrobacter sp. GA68 TaxID=2883480 RepID=UPI001D194370|nr:hypothetical protein [Porphyrobacter sp. GA68]
MLKRSVFPALLFGCVATAASASGPAVTEALPVGSDELAAGNNAGAIAEIMAADSLSLRDPARLINLGIAHAREGDRRRAEAYFRAALRSEERASLETITGEWVDSRELARQGLRKLAAGEFTAAGSFASLR